MDEQNSETVKKSTKDGSSRPRVIANEPDRTLERYMIEEFKKKAIGSKPVLFEEIDLSLYSPKAKLCGFQTSEDRLRLWIEAIILRYVDYLAAQPGFEIIWEETESYAFPDRPDKIKISVKKDEVKLFVLSLFVTTGRIQVQGSSYAHWATHEFPILRKVIDKLLASEDTLTESQKDFEANKDDEIESQMSSDSSEDEDEDETSEDDGKEEDSEIEYHDDSASIQTLTTTLSTLERNFMKSKEDLESEIYSLRTTLEEVLYVKDRLVNLENKLKAHVINFDDKLHHNDTEIDNANNRINELSTQLKKHQEQRTQLLTKQTQLNDQITELKTENSDLKREMFILKELVQKHENAIHSESTISSDDQAQITDLSTQRKPAYKEPETIPGKELDLLLITDSNGKFIQTDLLYPDAQIIHVKSYTLNQAQETLQEHIKDQPKQVLIHCGTNDLEKKNANQVIKESTYLLKTIQEKLPKTEIIYSSLLNRQDNLQYHVNEINNTMGQYCKLNKIKFIHNDNISNDSLFYDYKHLNRRGFKFFAKNLKSALYGTPTKSTGKQRQLARSTDHSFRPPQNTLPYIQPKQQPSQQMSYASVLAGNPQISHRESTFIEPTLTPSQYQRYTSQQQQHIDAPGTYYANQQPIVSKSLSNQSGLPFSLKTLIQQLQSFL